MKETLKCLFYCQNGRCKFLYKFKIIQKRPMEIIKMKENDNITVFHKNTPFTLKFRLG